jgi:hypothetical protein
MNRPDPESPRLLASGTIFIQIHDEASIPPTTKMKAVGLWSSMTRYQGIAKWES